HHHSSHDVHHHHRSQRLHAQSLLHQSGGHLPVGQLRLRLPLCYRVCGRQLPDHRTRAQREETQES
ncbi:hypothetical protein M9458_035457, partial [Cirrhinus mrigala]